MAKQVSEAPGRIAYLTIHSIVGGYAMQVVGIHYEVSERAVLRGVNRALAHQGYRVRKTVPGTRAEFDLGEYFEVDTQYNGCTCAKLVESLDEEQRRGRGRIGRGRTGPVRPAEEGQARQGRTR